MDAAQKVRPMDECDVASELAATLRRESLGELTIVSARPFADAGVLGYNSGVVVRLSDGTEYQLTVVRSR